MIDWRRLFSGRQKTRDIHFLRNVVATFRELIGLNNTALEIIADMGGSNRH